VKSAIIIYLLLYLPDSRRYAIVGVFSFPFSISRLLLLLIAFSRRYYFKRSVRSVYCISRKTKYGNERRWSNNDFNYGGSKRLCLDGLYQRIASTVIPIYSAFVRDLFISTKPPALLLWFVSLNSTLVYNDGATLLSSATGVIDNMHVAYLQLKLTAEHNYDCLSCKSIAFNNE
jgi:hypothetical protein